MERQQRKIITSFVRKFKALQKTPRAQGYSLSGRLALGRECEHVWTPGEFLLPHNILVTIAQIYLWHTENALNKSYFLTMTSWAMCSSGDCWAPRFTCSLRANPAHSGWRNTQSRFPSCGHGLLCCSWKRKRKEKKKTRSKPNPQGSVCWSLCLQCFSAASIFLWGPGARLAVPLWLRSRGAKGSISHTPVKTGSDDEAICLASALNYFLFVILH